MTRFDMDEVVKSCVFRSVTSPLYSTFREERTRHTAEVLRARRSPQTLCETAQHYLCLPWRNTEDVAWDHRHAHPPPTIAILGGGSFFARFIADEALRRGLHVRLLARDTDAAAEALRPATRHAAPRATWRLFSGDVTQPAAVERAVGGASLVVYACSAKGSAWGWRRYARVDVDGLRHTIDACRRVDAHLVVLVPRVGGVGWGWTSPFGWWRWGYHRAARQQERLLLRDDGTPTWRCFGNAEEKGSPMRFTIFRVGDLVYPSFNERIMVARNNDVTDPVRIVHLPKGDVDARMLAKVVLLATALCRSMVGGRIDITGQRRQGVELNHIDTVLHGLRCDHILQGESLKK